MDIADINRISQIDVQMSNLQNAIQGRRRTLNALLLSVRTQDPARKEARIAAAREDISDLERRLQALRTEKEELVVRVATFGVPENH